LKFSLNLQTSRRSRDPQSSILTRIVGRSRTSPAGPLQFTLLLAELAALLLAETAECFVVDVFLDPVTVQNVIE
jgi:hypothetical protein